MTTKKSTSVKSTSTKANTTANASSSDKLNMSLTSLWGLSSEDLKQEEISAKIISKKFAMDGAILDLQRQVSEKQILVNQIKAKASQYQAAILSNRMGEFNVQVEIDGYTANLKHSVEIEEAELVVTQLQNCLYYMEGLRETLFS